MTLGLFFFVLLKSFVFEVCFGFMFVGAFVLFFFFFFFFLCVCFLLLFGVLVGFFIGELVGLGQKVECMYTGELSCMFCM